MIKKYKKLTQNIKKFNTIYFFRHIRPDPDALGSVFGLKEIIKDNFKNKKIKIIGEDYPMLHHLFPKSSKIKSITTKDSFAIICDTANSSRIDCNKSKIQLWRNCSKSMIIDHHPSFEKFTNFSLIQPKKVATCEIIIDWAEFEKLKISKKAAEYLYYGLIADSGRFLFPNTTLNTYQKVITLFKSGINITKLHQKFYTKKIKYSKIQAYIIQNHKIKNKIGYMFFNKKTLTKFNSSPEEIKIHTNTLSGYEEIDIWVLAIEEDDYINVSLRSKPQYAINEVATKFKGGGHKNAAGIKVKNVKEFNKVIKELIKIIK